MKATHTHGCTACATPLAFPEDEYCDLCAEELQQQGQDRDYEDQAVEHEAFMAQYDDDPNPYHGTYSEE